MYNNQSSRGNMLLNTTPYICQIILLKMLPKVLTAQTVNNELMSNYMSSFPQVQDSLILMESSIPFFFITVSFSSL